MSKISYFERLSRFPHLASCYTESMETMRKRPKQERSQRRVDHVLQTAAEVFAEVGFDNATTNGIAERADVSIGWLYQFFPNKEALLEALIERYVEQLHRLMRFEELDHVPLSVVIQGMCESMIAFDQAHAGFKAVFMTTHASAMLHNAIVQRVEALLSRRFPSLHPERLHEYAVSGVAIFKGMMNLAAPPDQLPPQRTAELIHSALLGFLRRELLRDGYPLTEDL